MDKRELQDRTKQFVLRVLNLVDALPRTAGGRVISMQLVRAATSIGANYRGACRARSRAEFAAKLGVAVEEADESLYTGSSSSVTATFSPKRSSRIC